jgi:hypothetical protein
LLNNGKCLYGRKDNRQMLGSSSSNGVDAVIKFLLQNVAV